MTQTEKKTHEEKINSAETKAKVAEVTAFCQRNGLNAEQVGVWIWVSFDEDPGQVTRKVLKDAGFVWSPRRKKWAHNCGVESASSKGNPWEKYGSAVVSGRIAS